MIVFDYVIENRDLVSYDRISHKSLNEIDTCFKASNNVPGLNNFNRNKIYPK